MKSEILSQEKNVVTLKMTISSGEFASQFAATCAAVARKANIPGFRKGKAPRHIVEMRFGKQALQAEALEELLPKMIDQVVNDYNIEALDEPKVEIDQLEEGKDVELKVIFEVYPEVTLPELSDIEVELPRFAVTDQMIDDSVTNLRHREATPQVVDRPAVAADRVKALYSTTIRDDADEDISSHEPRVETFVLEGAALRSEILDALIGSKAGDKRQAEIRIDETYQDKTVAGKRACYEFEVQEVIEPVPAELTPEFFKKVSGKDLTTEEELRADIRASMEERLAADGRRSAENEAIEKIAAKTEVEIPESMVDRQKAHLMAKAEENVKQRTGMTLADYYATNGQDFETFKAELDREARHDVLNYLVVDACGRQLDISVERDDLESEIAQMAASYQVSAESVKAMLQNRPEDLRNLASSARYRKTVDEVMKLVKVAEVEKNVNETPSQD